MSALKFTIENGDSREIEISWSGIWKNARVMCDGVEIGAFTDQKDLRKGKVFALPDGRKLSVQLVQRLSIIELRVLCDGKPVRGSASDPRQRLKVAWQVVFFVAGLSTVAGLMAELFQVAFLSNIGVNFVSVIFGGVFFVLGWFIKRESMVALGLAVFMFALDGIVSAVVAAVQGQAAPIGALVARGFILIPMIQGFPAIRSIRAERSGKLSDARPLEPSVLSECDLLEPLPKERQLFNPSIPAARWIVVALIAAALIYVTFLFMQPAGSAR